MLKVLSEYWPILVTMGSFIWGLIKLYFVVTKMKDTTIPGIEKRIDLIEENNTTQNAYMEQMALDVREMKTDIKWIKEQKY